MFSRGNFRRFLTAVWEHLTDHKVTVGPSTSVYAFLATSVHRNLYKIDTQ